MTTSVADLIAADVLTMSDGYRTKRSEHANEGYRILRVADVLNDDVRLDGPDFVSSEFTKAIGVKAAQAGDVLLTTKGTVGRVAVMPATDQAVVYSPQLCFFRVRDTSRLDPRWLSYWFRSGDFMRQASHRKDNTDMAAYINLADIRSLSLVLPAIHEQRGIAEVLGALDDKIAANAVSHEAASRLAIALAQSDQSVRLDQVADQVKGTVAPASFGAALVDHFSLPAFDVGAGPEVVAGATIKSNKTRVAGNTVLISKLNPRFPRIWDVIQTDDSRPALASTEFIPVTSKLIPSSVLWAALSAPEFASALESKVAGTSGSHQRVKPADLLATEIADPRSLSAGAVASIASLGQIRAALTKETAELVATRDALLPLLMSGRVTVKAAESVVGEVL